MSIITLAHGGGGTLQNNLIRREILRYFNAPELSSLPDGALTSENLVISTDSFVITPRFFPGGDIGKLAVAGTVNDVLVSGGIPRYLTCSLIIEEGLELAELQKILHSMAECAQESGVSIVTGDTKVVPRGSGDGLYINTTGIGFKRPGIELDRQRFADGDKILVSGHIGAHGLSVLARRFQLDCGSLQSDCAPLTAVVEALLSSAGSELKFMRDATRGGVLGVTSEIFENAPCGAVVYQEQLPMLPETAAIAKLLGIDPGFAACEGCLVAVIGSSAADAVLAAWHAVPGCEKAAVIGSVNNTCGQLMLENSWGSRRQLVVPSGDQLPRIC